MMILGQTTPSGTDLGGRSGRRKTQEVERIDRLGWVSTVHDPGCTDDVPICDGPAVGANSALAAAYRSRTSAAST